jgi:hypothetical protein
MAKGGFLSLFTFEHSWKRPARGMADALRSKYELPESMMPDSAAMKPVPEFLPLPQGKVHSRDL